MHENSSVRVDIAIDYSYIEAISSEVRARARSRPEVAPEPQRALISPSVSGTDYSVVRSNH